MNVVREIAEVSVSLPDIPCGPHEVLAILSAHFIGVLASSCYAERHGRELLLITEDPAQAQGVLQTEGYQCRLEEVVLVGLTQNRPDMAARYGCQLANAGIGILRSHLASHDGDAYYAAFKTTDNHHAAQVLAAGQLA